MQKQGINKLTIKNKLQVAGIARALPFSMMRGGAFRGMFGAMISGIVGSALIIGLSSEALAQRDFSNVEISTTKVTDSIYMLTGAGGNIAVSAGADGVFMIDDQFAPLSEKILAAISEISDKPISYVVNTHWHGDHTGGNENIGNAGAVIVAHENVRKRMSTPQFMKAFGREVPASPDSALPVITFTEDVSFYFNDSEIQVRHLPHAHTDGDSMVYFSDDNVLHMGDTFFNGFFPFIDQSSGGSLDGIIEAAERALSISDADTSIIPGHGPISGQADLQTYIAMLKEVKDTMTPLAKSGQSREEVIAAKPLSALSEQWGNGFMKPDVFTGIVYDILSGS